MEFIKTVSESSHNYISLLLLRKEWKRTMNHHRLFVAHITLLPPHTSVLAENRLFFLFSIPKKKTAAFLCQLEATNFHTIQKSTVFFLVFYVFFHGKINIDEIIFGGIMACGYHMHACGWRWKV